MSRRWLTGGDFPVILPPACCGRLRDPAGPGASSFAGAAIAGYPDARTALFLCNRPDSCVNPQLQPDKSASRTLDRTVARCPDAPYAIRHKPRFRCTETSRNPCVCRALCSMTNRDMPHWSGQSPTGR